MKKVLAVFLTAILIIALVGCGGNKRTPIELTLSTEDAEAILAAAGILLPDAESAPGAGTTIEWYSWFDDFHNYSENEVINTGYFTFREKYGCDIQWTECVWNDRFSQLAALMLGGTSPDFYNAESENFPYYAIHGTFQPVNDYIDLDDPLWSGIADYMRNYFSLGNDIYLLCTDLYFGSILAYNRRVINEWGFDDPAELFYNNEWTWNEFYDMCIDFSDPDSKTYALDGWFYSGALQRSCGLPIISYDLETKSFVSNMDNPALERAGNLLYDLNKNEAIWPYYSNGYKVRNQGSSSAADFGDGLKEGLLLFSCGGPYHITGPVDEISAEYADVTANELMFVPMPRDPDGDGSQFVESDPMGYCIVNNAPNPEGVALLAMCDRFKAIDPTVMSVDRMQKVEKYLWTDEMLEMYDTCIELANSGMVVLAYNENALGSDLGSICTEIERNGMQSNAVTWAQIKEQNEDRITYFLEDLNSEINDFINS